MFVAFVVASTLAQAWDLGQANLVAHALDRLNHGISCLSYSNYLSWAFRESHPS